MSQIYNHNKIENTWKDKWFKNNLYEAVDFSDKPKKYILAELPYPSGEYLHVGHMMRYTVPEIYSRYLRMNGYNVMFPMGWDSFGLPAETFAIKTKKTPQEVIANAVISYKKSMQDMGYAIDWNREIITSEPEYYKWTQWIFLQLFEKGLVEQRELPVWWCEELGVLADEEVLADPSSPTGKKAERDGYPVYRKTLTQWVLKITDYADKLLEGLDSVDYFDSVKQGQINWIGKRTGINIDYPIADSNQVITCFTTRPDTNFGATFIVLAPEHPFAQDVANSDSAVKKYIELSLAKSELERQEEKRSKTGVFTGFYALNRLNDKKIPVWISDFVLGDYGTGAVVGVPGHDLRDFEFAQKFGLPVIKVIKAVNDSNNEVKTIDDVFEDYGEVINSEFLNGLDSEKAIKTVIEHLENNKWGEKSVTYKLRDQIWSRQRYWGDPIPLLHREDGKIEADHQLPVTLPVLEEFLPEKGQAPLEKVPDWFNVKAKDGTNAKRETDTMPTWAGSNWYYMRYIDPKNSENFADFEKLKYWMPVDKYFGDAGHTTAHLLYTRFWYKFLYDHKYVPTNEPFQWRMSGGLLLGADRKKMSKSRPEYVVNPKDVLDNYGADAARVYLSFIGPYDETYPWNENGIKACYRFVKNVYALKLKISEEPSDKNTEKALNKMIKNVTKMIEDLKMNTAVSEMMIFLNHLKKLDSVNKNILLDFIKVISPFAPFVTEDLWQELNNYDSWTKENSVHVQPWPSYNKEKLIDDEITLPIQINGKLRGEINVETSITEEHVKEIVLKEKSVKKYLTGKNVKKIIYIKNKIVNIVV
ncbi:leucine--tRNA ligase [Patescibacteria group bacterium]